MQYKWDFSKNENMDGADILEGKEDVGFVAQDIYKYVPEIVSKPDNEDEGMWGLDYSKLTVILTAAMQEQQDQIESQQKEIDELQEQVQYLMDKVK